MCGQVGQGGGSWCEPGASAECVGREGGGAAARPRSLPAILLAAALGNPLQAMCCLSASHLLHFSVLAGAVVVVLPRLPACLPVCLCTGVCLRRPPLA